MRSFFLGPAVLLVALGSAQTVRLQIKFPKGHTDRFITSSDFEEYIGRKSDGDWISIQTNQSASMRMKAIASSKAASTVRLTYESFKSSRTVNGRTAPGGGASARLVGKSLSLKISSTGKVLGVTGADLLAASLLEGAPRETQKRAANLFTAKSIRGSLELALGNSVPTRPVGIGDTWTNEIEFGQGAFTMSMDLAMTLEGVVVRHGHRVAEIGITGSGSLTASGESVYPGMTLSSNSFDISGTSSFDIDRGWTVQQSMTITVEAEVTAPGKEALPIRMRMRVGSAVSPIR